ncbi:MAG TPA: polymorphic toxin-type HINT domain-containing protein, partial [Pirellulaceae bacterium]|nr:polymorphic toxin-type HINT domain-containing protein [Pirellulaceae bacterium]
IARLTDRQVNWNASDGSLEVEGIDDPLRTLGDATPEQITRADYRLIRLRAYDVWADGTLDQINVETLQPWQWIQEHEAHIGAFAPLPLDAVEMGLPEGMTGTVDDILPCPEFEAGRGRIVLTTVNHLNREVLELTLEGESSPRETLRPTGTHKFYSVSSGHWLSASELQPGETLDGINGKVTVVASRKLPGTRRVYNFTVQGEHLYRVANCGVLVHNNGCSRPATHAYREGWDRIFAPNRVAGSADDMVIDSYGVLRRRSDIPGQAHHLNQDAAFRQRIAQRDGVSVKLEGNAFTDVGMPHYNAHESMESFWDIYRRGGMDAGNLPTNTQYNRALYNGLQESGLSPAEALRAVRAAKAQQLGAGLRGSDLVPRLPGRINQVPRGN